MLAPIAAIIVGFALLIWGADRFVAGAAATARNLGVSPLIVGVTIVGLGTSAPEMLVSAMAAFDGNPGLAVGNALGSNITNITLILGITAVVTPLQVRSEILRREMPLLLATMLGALILLLDRHLGRPDGILLLLGMGVMLFWLTRLAIGGRSDALVGEYESEIPSGMSTGKALLWLTLGLALLLISSRALVWGAVQVASTLGVSDLVIGLTVVAIGTSLPELAASVMSARKGEHDIAIGNVIGSNIFNLLVVLGLPGLIHPFELPEMALTRDYSVMVGLTVGLFAVSYGFNRPGRINRLEGALLLLAFCGYQALLYVTERPAL